MSEQVKSESLGTAPSTSKNISNMTRIQRNVAEKQRRDKLNGYISELANIVPMVSMSSKRLDKTSILRLSAAHLRLSKSPLSCPKKFRKTFKWCPSFLTAQQVRDILESVDGFLIVTSSSGKILFTSNSVERYLGHQNIDMIGHSLFVFIHPEDLNTVKEEMEKLRLASLKCDDSKPAPRCSFRCRMKEKGQPRSEVATYQFVHFAGDMTISNDEETSNKSMKCAAVVTHIFKAFVRIVEANPYSELSLEDACADEYVTRHSLDGTIIFADHRLSTITGHLPQEVISFSAYKYILPEDISIALFAHHLMFSSDKGTGMVVYRLRTRDDKYVYLKSVGCLQFDRATSQVDHFVCVNQHLSDAEGEAQLKYFVDRFIPHIRDSSEIRLFESVKALQVTGLKPPNSVAGSREYLHFKETQSNVRNCHNLHTTKASKFTLHSSNLPESINSELSCDGSSSKSEDATESYSPRNIFLGENNSKEACELKTGKDIFMAVSENFKNSTPSLKGQNISIKKEILSNLSDKTSEFPSNFPQTLHNSVSEHSRVMFAKEVPQANDLYSMKKEINEDSKTNAESFLGVKSNIMLSTGSVTDLKSKNVKAVVEHAKLGDKIKSNLSTDINDVVMETNLWPMETSSESSASNAMSEETFSSTMKGCGEDPNFYFMPEAEMKDYSESSDDISSILNSSLPFDDSSLPSVDGWSECFRPEDVIRSSNAESSVNVKALSKH